MGYMLRIRGTSGSLRAQRRRARGVGCEVLVLRRISNVRYQGSRCSRAQVARSGGILCRGLFCPKASLREFLTKFARCGGRTRRRNKQCRQEAYMRRGT